MIWFILAIILTIILVIVLGIRTDDYNFNYKVSKRMLFGLLGMLLVIPGCITTVKTGEVGIKTTFGKITSTNLKEGVQLKAPWQDVVKLNIKVQKYENETALETSTKDMQIVNSVIVSINYQLDEDAVVDIYRSVGAAYDTVVLEPAIQESVKGSISQFNAEELVNKRNEVGIAIQDALIKRVEQYGIKILSVSLKNFDFSAEYNASIENKTIAEQKALTAQQELEISKAEAEKKKVEAQGEAEANRLKEQTITKEILMQQFIEKWDGKLPTNYAGEDVMSIFGINN